MDKIFRQCPGSLPDKDLAFAGSPQEHHVLPYFVEDRSAGQYSYTDFVSHVHKQVLSK